MTRLAHGDTLRLASRSIQDRLLARHRSDRVWCEAQLEADQMPETHDGSTRQLKSIEKAERPLITKHLSRQDEIHLVVRALCRRDDFEPTSLVRQTDDLSLVTEQRRPIVVRPEV